MRLIFTLLRSDLAIALGCIVLLVFGIAAIIGEVLINFVPAFDPARVRLSEKLLAPGSSASDLVQLQDLPLLGRYWLGTDELGRDVLSRMLQGATVSLLIGFVSVGIAMLVGIIVGAVAGFYGHKKIGPVSVDAVLMRITDVFLCFPSFFLILTVVALLPPSIYNIMIVIGLTSWMGMARFVRAEFMSLRSQDYVLAAQAMGFSARRIMFRHMLPNAMAPVLVSATIGVATAILIESSLSFLGFGVQPPDATWGNILADGRLFIFDAPWLFFIPGVAIIVVVLAFNLVGEGLREALNPKLRRL